MEAGALLHMRPEYARSMTPLCYFSERGMKGRTLFFCSGAGIYVLAPDRIPAAPLSATGRYGAEVLLCGKLLREELLSWQGDLTGNP